MTASSSPLALVVIVGPQASGKSTVAAALTEELRRQGELVALVELDRIAAMALPTLPSWETAHGIFESVTGQWARSELTRVVAEGSGSHHEVSRLRTQAPSTAAIVTVAITAPFQVAFARAQADSTRGISREHAFLSKVYARWPSELALIDADVLLDTSQLNIQQCIERIQATIGSAQSSRVLR